MKKWEGVALVTGASSGIGREYALQMTQRGCDVMLVARRADRLEELATEVRAKYGRQVWVMAADLADPAATAGLLERIATEGVTPAYLVNNAGRGYYGPALRADTAAVAEILRLNIESLTALTLEIGRRMAERGSGGILNVASTAAFQPVPYLSVYAATKAYVVSFSEALAAELQGKGVRVFTVCPGPVKTEFGAVAGVPSTMMIGGTTPEAMVRRSLDAYEKQIWGDTYIDGALNEAGAFLSRFAPRFLLTRALGLAIGFNQPTR